MRCAGSATAVLVGCFSAEAAIPGRPICEAQWSLPHKDFRSMCNSMRGSPEYSKQGCSGAALLREAPAASALDHPKVPINFTPS